MSTERKNKSIALISLCMDDWGGSEELWARSIPYLQAAGYSVVVYKESVNTQHPEIKKLADIGVVFKSLKPSRRIPKMRYTLKRAYEKIGNRLKIATYHWNDLPDLFKRQLIKNPPGFVIIAQAINFDGLAYAHECLTQGIPYSIIVQKAVSFYWPSVPDRAYMKAALLKARKVYFVSQHNQTLTEEQFGIRLPHATVLSNPIKTLRTCVPYPCTDDGFKLACVARLFLIDKGQDILLRILAMPKWQNRPVKVSFIGKGLDAEPLQSLARLLKVKNVIFAGHISDVSRLWENYHALILPSRSEGMALSVLEAMAAGRTVITTHSGGHAEIITHGTTGFIGEANEASFDHAMEEAWSKREDWDAIGKQAHDFISREIPLYPEKDFSLSLLNLLHE